MKAAIDALVALVKTTTGFASFRGTSGPFWDVAPEGTPFPYMVVGQVGGSRPLYGFGGGSYIEPVVAQITLYDVALETVSANAETVCAAMDFSTLALAGGQLCRNLYRLEAPRVRAQEIEGKGRRVYQAVIQYRLNVQRTVGA